MLVREAEDDPTGSPMRVKIKTALSSAVNIPGLGAYHSKELSGE